MYYNIICCILSLAFTGDIREVTQALDDGQVKATSYVTAVNNL